VSELCDAWRVALTPVVLRHPNGWSQPVLRFIDGDPPQLYVGLDSTACTRDGHTMIDFAISTVALTFFPGVRLAQAWLSVAWVGYLQHEALELATVDGRAVLDPHAAPYVSNAVNRGLRCGFPERLTHETIVTAFELLMPRSEAEQMIFEWWSPPGRTDWPYESAINLQVDE
jgi:hypothetical protein